MTLPEIFVPNDAMLKALRMFGYEPDGPFDTWDNEMVNSDAVRIVAGAIAIERDRCLRAATALNGPHLERVIKEGLEP